MVTLALIVVNALVYFVFQAGDRPATQKAATYYFSSDLPAIELPRFAATLETARRPARRCACCARSRAGARRGVAAILAAMQHDREFMRDLKGGVLVAGERSRARGVAPAARTLRGPAAARSSPSASRCSPDGSWFGLLTHQFLHGDAMHWFGNMLVLLLAGPFAEAALGRARFLLAYLFAGACAGALAPAR